MNKFVELHYTEPIYPGQIIARKKGSSYGQCGPDKKSNRYWLHACLVTIDASTEEMGVQEHLL